MHLQNFRPTLILRSASFEKFPTHNYYCNKVDYRLEVRIEDSNILIVGYTVF